MKCCSTCLHSSVYNGVMCCTLPYEIIQEIDPDGLCENWEDADEA